MLIECVCLYPCSDIVSHSKDVGIYKRNLYQIFCRSSFCCWTASLNKIHFSQEGSSHDRGLYARCFEELFDLSNSDTTSTSRFKFSVSVFELYNEQVCLSTQLLSIPSAFHWTQTLTVDFILFCRYGTCFQNLVMVFRRS